MYPNSSIQTVLSNSNPRRPLNATHLPCRAALAALGAGKRPRAGVESLLHALPRPDDPVLRVFLERLVFRALAAEDVAQHVVAFVTFVGQKLEARRRDERDGDLERPCVGL